MLNTPTTPPPLAHTYTAFLERGRGYNGEAEKSDTLTTYVDGSRKFNSVFSIRGLIVVKYAIICVRQRNYFKNLKLL